MALFSNSSNIHISGQPTFTIQADDPSPEKGLEILYKHAAPGALHDSGERFDPPNCHPGTRTAVLEEIMSWIDNVNFVQPVMWMNGAMGGGKSSIAQALAEIYHQKRQLSGSFFFARASPARNNEKRLVATLAYQMSKELPEIRPYISAPILHDPLIFDSSLKAQIDALIMRPHSYIPSSDGSATSKPRLIIIDGLDECASREAQAHIVKSFVSSIAEHQIRHPRSLRFLIVSRPETDIENAFRDPLVFHYVKYLLLNERWLPSDDIRRFLIQSFEDIKRNHPIRKTFPEDWPASLDVEKIVEKSSGQFIYASVVIKFLQAPRNHPIEALKVIVGLTKDAQSRPYAQLDALYEHIFSQVKDLPLVLRILCIKLQPFSRANDTAMINNVLDLPQGMLSIALTDLVSVLEPDLSGNIVFYHASLSEFLEERDRSGRFYVNNEEVFIDLACCCIPFDINRNPDTIFYRFLFFKLMYGYLSAEGCSSLCDVLPNMKIFPDLEYCDLELRSVTDWLGWFFAEYTKTKQPSCLDSAMESCVDYILRQFKAFPFSGFDRTDGLDMWIFPMQSAHTDFFLTIRKCAIVTGLDRSELENFQTSQAAKFCWKLFSLIPVSILENVELFGQYAMTSDRFLKCATRLSTAITKMHVSGKNYGFTNDLVCEVLSLLLEHTPVSKDLFKIFTDHMVECASETPPEDGSFEDLASEYIHSRHGSGLRGQTWLRPALSTYMQKTRKAIPNIDSIIEEEWMAELRGTKTYPAIWKRKITSGFREYIRKTKKFITQSKY